MISDELWEALQGALVSRLKDKIVSVRTAAVFGLERLQSEEEDYVVTELLRLASTDPNKYVDGC